MPVKPKVRYHRDGWVTLSTDPRKIVATWGKLVKGPFEVWAYPRGKERGLGISVSTRRLADDWVRGWAAVTPES